MHRGRALDGLRRPRGAAAAVVVGLLVLAILVARLAWASQGEPGQPDLEVFSQPDCPHCVRAMTFVSDLREQHPGLRIVVHDVGRDPVALERLAALAAAQGISRLGVPAFRVGDRLLIGFDEAETTGRALQALLLPRPSGPAAGPPRGPEDSVLVPVLGQVSVRDFGLPAFTVIVGLLDGFNPCAMWVLLFVLSLLVNLRDRFRMFLIGGTFVLVSGVVYFAFMAAWLNVFLLVGLSRPSQVILGGMALVAGLVNVKDCVAPGRGVSIGIPAAAKPGLYARVRGVVQAENLWAALGAVMALAALVNVVEVLCTAGLPALYTRILSLHLLPTWQYYLYLALYNLAYVLDDSLVLLVATVTLRRRKLREGGGRLLKLVSGTVMTVLGLVLILRPDWLAHLAGNA